MPVPTPRRAVLFEGNPTPSGADTDTMHVREIRVREIPTRLARLSLYVEFREPLDGSEVSYVLSRHPGGSVTDVPLGKLPSLAHRAADAGVVFLASFSDVEIGALGEYRVTVLVDGVVAHVQSFEVVGPRD